MLARQPGVDKVYYNNPRMSPFPRTQELCPGTGFEEIEVIHDPLTRLVGKGVLWVFLDLYHSDLQEHLVAKEEKVWGARRGEEMELRRWEFKQYMRKIGLPVQPCVKVVGMDALRKELRKPGKKFVKTNVRGDFETFPSHRFDVTEPRLDEIEHVLGPLKDDYEFVVEDDIPNAVEVGYDGITVDGEFPSHAMIAFEIKDVGMMGRSLPYAQVPKPVRQVNDRLVPAFTGYKYRGFFSSEIRYTKDHVANLIDPCCRLGTPSNELLQELFKGWPETLEGGADGKMVSPEPTGGPFGVLIMLHSEFGVSDWVNVYYPKELDPYVKLRFHCRTKAGINTIPPQVIGMPDLGCVVGTGKTLLDAIKVAYERACQVEAYGLVVNKESIPQGMGVIAEAEKLGIHFTNSPPSVQQLAALVS